MRKLASIQKIIKVEPIPGADKIEVYTVLGWKVVGKKGEFKPGDLVVYFEIDSLIPYTEWSSFLWKEKDDKNKPYRLRTIKFKGQISQGLIQPLSILEGKKYESDKRESPIYEWKEGQDVTKLLGITKYEPPTPANLIGQIKGTFPSFIPKTDEIRIQTCPEVIEEFKGKEIYITNKIDGTSCTIYFNNGEFGVCSRNLELQENKDHTFWKIVERYNLKQKLIELNKNIAIQGEVYGEGIQKNPVGIKGQDIAIFNVYDINEGKYLDYPDMINIVEKLGLKTVPVEYVGIFKEDWDLNKLMEMAKGNYPNTHNIREGIVIRTTKEGYSNALKGRMSFKVINNDYLLKKGE